MRADGMASLQHVTRHKLSTDKYGMVDQRVNKIGVVKGIIQIQINLSPWEHRIERDSH